MTRVFANSRCFAALLLAIAGLAGVTRAAAEPVFPPGIRVGLEPAAGLKVSTRFPGFEDAERDVQVSILDLPAAAYDQMLRATFSADQAGLTGVKRESFPFKNGVGYLLSAQATEAGAAVRRFFLIATPIVGNERDLVTVIKVGVPAKARAVYSDAVIRKMLASLTFRQISVDEQLAQLPFKLEDRAGFRVFQVMREGGVILTEGPGDDLRKQPVLIVSAGPGAPASADERGRFARELLSTAPLRDITVQLAEPMRIGGGPGYEIRAQAETPDGNPVKIVQWVRFGGSGFLRVVGTVPPDQWDAFFPRFRAVRDGIAIR
jgi:hypothetical protein